MDSELVAVDAVDSARTGATRAASGLSLALLALLAPGALHSAGPGSIILGPGEVVEGSSGTVTAQFFVSVAFEYQLVQCQTNDPHCNRKTVPVCVDFHTVAGSATPGEDFEPASGTLQATLTFDGPGLLEVGAIDVQVIGDTTIEEDETFRVVLTNPTAACSNQTNLQVPSAEVVIRDDDAPVASAQVAINDVTVREGSSGFRNVVFSVTLAQPAAAQVQVDFQTVDGTATAGRLGDYRSASGTVTIPAGQTSGTVAVMVRGDTLREIDETFTVRLGNPVNATIVDGAGRAIIVNDDPL